MTTLNPYRAVQGQLWKRNEISQWNEENYLQFFSLVSRFTIEGTVKVTLESLLMVEQDAFGGRLPFLQEIFTRFNQLTTDPKATPHKFYNKLASTMRTVGAYIKLNPSVVTAQMRSVIESNPRLAWMLKHFELKNTKTNIPVVQQTKYDTVDSKPTIVKNPEDANIRMMESVTNLADALSYLTGTLTRKEMKEMSAKEKIGAAVNILKALQQARSHRPNIGVINNLTIHKADRDDLEKAMLDLANQ